MTVRRVGIKASKILAISNLKMETTREKGGTVRIIVFRYSNKYKDYLSVRTASELLRKRIPLDTLSQHSPRLQNSRSSHLFMGGRRGAMRVGQVTTRPKQSNSSFSTSHHAKKRVSASNGVT